VSVAQPAWQALSLVGEDLPSLDFCSVRELELRVEAVDSVGRFLLKLVDGPHLVAKHQVDIKGSHQEFDALRSLSKTLNGTNAQHSLDDETKLLESVGNWVTEHLLGDIAKEIADTAPVIVWLEVPAGPAEWLAEVPLGIAIGYDVPLARRQAVFVIKVAPPRGLKLSEVPECLRVLAVFATPTNEQALNLRKERFALSRMADALVADHKFLDLHVLQYGATVERLRRALRDAAGWDVVHFSGHGDVGRLYLENDQGNSEELPNQELLQLLADARGRLKLVVLSSCLSATSAVSPTLVSLGAAPNPSVNLHPSSDAVRHSFAFEVARRVGCAVIAMRYNVSDSFAVDFTKSVFDSIWSLSHTAFGAAGVAVQETTKPPPTSGTPARSAFTPAVFGHADAKLRLVPPDRRGPTTSPILRMATFPAEPARFIGRVGVLARMNSGLAPHSGVRALILLGIPEVGKSACALEVAYGRRDYFLGGLEWFKCVTGRNASDMYEEFERKLKALLKIDRQNDDEQRWLQDIAEAIEGRHALIVVDGAENLMSSSGVWDDLRWGDLLQALCSHSGFGRVIVTSRVRPAVIPPGMEIVPVPVLNLEESVLLAQDLPNIARLLSGDKTEKALALGILEAARGHPRLVSLADTCVSDRDTLNTLLAEANQQWSNGGFAYGPFLNGTEVPEERYELLLESWKRHIERVERQRFERETRNVANAIGPLDPTADDAYRRGEHLRSQGQLSEATDAFRVAAGAGDPEAALKVGDLLWAEGNPSEAKGWYELAAQARIGQAAFQLGWLLLNEEGDRQGAMRWWQVAAQERHVEAAFRLAELLWQEGKPSEAKGWYELAARAGDTQAAFQLGWLLRNEEGDSQGASAWWQKAATPRHADAAFQLGELRWSEGSPGEAKVWYHQAADAGHAYAMYQLGELLLREEHDEPGAREWLKRSEAAGEAKAAQALRALDS
jgi:TPR repeat protein